MSEQINGRKVFSLFEVSKSIQKTIANRYGNQYWIKTEMIKLNFYKHSGHCYPDLVDKENGKVVAQMRATLWRHDYIRINNEFAKILKEQLKGGIKVLILAKISYSPEHGISLNIVDIDPSYTLGDLEKEKNDTINKLKAEGIFNKNKSLSLPLLPQRIAVISVETSKGFSDFKQVLESAQKQWGYCFFQMIFPSLLQGDGAVKTILLQLNNIKKVIKHFDLVVIIRGGGGDVGLSCYNNYLLAKEIACFPIPVITGIGHSTNETVAEMVAYQDAITPTKLAEILIQHFHNFSVPVQNAKKSIVNNTAFFISETKLGLDNTIKLYRSIAKNLILKRKNSLLESSQKVIRSSNILIMSNKQKLLQTQYNIIKDYSHNITQNKLTLKAFINRMFLLAKSELKTENLNLKNIEQNIVIMSPENVLKRGYSITFLNGKSVNSINNLKEGDLIETKLYEGTAISKVTSTTKKS